MHSRKGAKLMPKPQSGDEKKHGDKLESLIERTGGKAAPEETRRQRADNPADVQDDDEDVLDEGAENDADEELEDELDDDDMDDEEDEEEDDKDEDDDRDTRR
jgi:hypothetical protein